MKSKIYIKTRRMVRESFQAAAIFAILPFVIFAGRLSAQTTSIPSGTGYNIPAAGEYVLSGVIVFGGITGTMTGVTLAITEGSLVSANSTHALYFNNGGAVITNAGMISSAASWASSGIYSDGGPSFIDNTATGVIEGSSKGVFLSGGGTVTNAGLIKSMSYYDYGIHAQRGAVAILNNGGTIQGGQGGIQLTAGGTVTNTGVISGTSNYYASNSHGVYSHGASALVINGTTGLLRGTSAGVTLRAGGTVVNSGSIINPSYYGSQSAYGVFTAGSSALIINNASGIISSTYAGVQMAGGGEIANGGVIRGGEYAITNLGASILVTNTTDGLLSGDHSGIWFQYGGTLSNSGTILGAHFNGVYAHGLAVTVSNNAGGLIHSAEIGIHAMAGGTFANSGTIIGGTVSGITSYTDSAVTNDAGLIQGGIAGVSLYAGGTVTNTGTILATGRPDGAYTFAVDIAGEATISNLGGVIEGADVGVIMVSGGTLTNSGTINGISDTGLVSLQGTIVTNTTGGVIRGGDHAVYLDEGDDGDAAHEVRLWNSSTLAGQLFIAGDASQLVLNGAAGSETAYTSAVTGPTTFTGTLIKRGAGSWTMDTDDLDMRTVDVREGTLAVAWDATQLKDATVNIATGATLGVHAATDATVANALAGDGLVNLRNTGDAQSVTFSLQPFSPSALSFTGTIGVGGGARTSKFNFNDTAQTILANATLQLAENSETTLDANRTIGGLDLAGGTFIVKTDTTSGIAPHMLTVKTLSVGETSGTAATKIGIDTDVLSGINPPAPPGHGLNGNIFDVDVAPPDYLLHERTIVRSTESGPADGIAFELIDSNGAPLPSGASTLTYGQNSATPVGKNTYGYNAITQDGDILLNYGLVSIDALSDAESLVINPADAHDDTLSAQLTGAGAAGFTFTGSRTIVLGHGGNDYTGATLITGSATLTTAGASNIIASSTSVSITAGAAFDTGNTTQTLRNLSGAGAIRIGTGALNIDNNTDGLVFSGTIDGAGELTLTAGSVLTLTGDNTHTGSTTIETGAHLQLGAGQGGGASGMIASATVANSGTLTINRSGNITHTGAIIGAGDLVQRGSGTTTLTGDNALTGKLVVENGALQIGDGAANGWAPDTAIAADATVADAASLIFNRSDLVTYAGVIDGAGDIAAIGDGVVVLGKAQRHTGSTTVKNGTLRLAAENAIRTSRGITLEHATLDLGNKLQTLQNLHAVGGAIHYHTPGSNDTTYTTLTITGDYTGETTGRMNVDLANKQTDRLIISGSADGAHHIVFTSMNDTRPHDPARKYALLVVDYEYGDPVFTSDGIEFGMITYELHQGDGGAIMPDTSAYYLTAGNSISRGGDAILSTAGVMTADLHYGLDNVHKRMGDIRVNMPADHLATLGDRAGIPHDRGAPARSHDRGNIWARANTYRLNTDSHFGNSRVRQDTHGLTVGADKIFAIKNALLMAGVHAGMSYSDRSFEALGHKYGDGNSTILGGGLYALWIHDAGWFVDSVLRLDRSESELNARGVDGYLSRGKYKNNIQGVSVEAGRRFVNGRYWVEPSAQAAVAWINGTGYTMRNDRHRDIQVRIGDADSWQYSAQVRTGANFERWIPYIKFGVVKSDISGGEVTVEGRTQSPGFEGWRFETGAGAGYLIDERSQLYLDYEYNKAPHYERPWSINLGYRRAW
ncbi:outer membrane autotransporter protein [Ereboglobus sp. PH5-10]|uniref:autotransporter outer membrane beta-barrel domain-containing protein n=1 Tax=Ereboglobus sp. PH5-10 TaxID=2940629 RepID=UPI002406FC95|nr:autotransporter outer membrane beta-barrel domain-containing protein [Ereboglobus sp. PH5-10]MDF9826749.1 outer membrane autotransporter protein [Ereboglobus sp. PH5-10]